MDKSYRCVEVLGECVPIGYSPASVVQMVKENIIPYVLYLNELDAANLNRLECYIMLALGLRHRFPNITTSEVSQIFREESLNEMREGIKMALSLLNE